MLCPHEAESHLGALLHRRVECDAEEVQEHGGEELWLPLNVCDVCVVPSMDGGGRRESANNSVTVEVKVFVTMPLLQKRVPWTRIISPRVPFYLPSISLCRCPQSHICIMYTGSWPGHHSVCRS